MGPIGYVVLGAVALLLVGVVFAMRHRTRNTRHVPPDADRGLDTAQRVHEAQALSTLPRNHGPF